MVPQMDLRWYPQGTLLGSIMEVLFLIDGGARNGNQEGKDSSFASLIPEGRNRAAQAGRSGAGRRTGRSQTRDNGPDTRAVAVRICGGGTRVHVQARGAVVANDKHVALGGVAR